MMVATLIVLAVLGLLGAFDNLVHHELRARLPARVSARRELALHAVHGVIYGAIFLSLAWAEWHGWWAWALAALLLAKLVMTVTGLQEEGRSRRLPGFERTLHTVLAVGYGVFLAVLVPVLLGWAMSRTAVAPAHYGPLSWLLTVYGVLVIAWVLRTALAARRLFRLRRAMAAQPDGPPHSGSRRRTVLVTGGSGLIGTSLVENLLEDGCRVIVYTRDALQVRATYGQRVLAVEHLDQVPAETRIDAVVNLAGAQVLGWWWTKARKAHLMDSRLQVTQAVVQLIARLQHPPKVLVTASAAGFYGMRGAERLNESEPGQPVFMSQLCAEWEKAANGARQYGTRVAMLRFGPVLARHGGGFPPLSLAARLGFGAVLGHGRQIVPWIHIDDAVGLIRFAIEASALSGPLNATAPEPVSQRDFAAALARRYRRPLWLAVPGWLLRLTLGEMSQLVLAGQCPAPAKVRSAGYRFRFPALDAALRDLAGARAQTMALDLKKKPGHGRGRASRGLQE